MYGCGLRIGEAQSLAISSIDSKRNILTIIGKGNKERLIPLPQHLLDSLRVIWTTHKHKVLLFPNDKGTNTVSSGALYKAFRLAALEVGLDIDVIKPHSLRHSYATRLMEAGVEMRIIQILLGHSDIRSTTVYTHLTEPTRQRLHITLNSIMTDLTNCQ